ncbi:related to mannosyltransferase [Cephalotrichum gorgonifer]|uniref:Mannosyltransferase n=1 Tax=Cephalotrichum gorgonifer TaxID=2041049 RepID=A0AAE8SSB3_9PEZI|nr:related to mannosyltransferase [Cephalotrichum gorgonifer]
MAPPPPPPQERVFVHPDASHAKKKKPSAYGVQPIKIFYCFLAANILSALFAPMQDCDETFNYWEPTHYVSHGYGLQTWEYSPDYAIRSWLYIVLHAIPGNIRRLLPNPTKVSEFYFIRYALAFFCSLCQTLFFQAICLVLTPRVGLIFVVALVTSPGNFHASTAFLPSSFAMYTAMLGTTAFLSWHGRVKTSRGIYWFAAGAIFGWPFSAALCAPFVAEELLLSFYRSGGEIYEMFIRFARGAVGALFMIAGDVAVNAFFYKKVEFVAWNIVKYNIFSKSGGPELYGTEPVTFYFRNLLLNFNIWFVLAISVFPLALLHDLFRSTPGRFVSLRTAAITLPFYLWFGIFTAQPHKEERFMYPAYPFLALNAAISAHILLAAIGTSNPKSLISKIPGKIRLFAVAALFLSATALGLARIYGTYAAYSAPLNIYEPLGAGAMGEEGVVGNAGDIVCLGKEWYRFPSSYFLPRGMHAKFIRSEFRGLLPGEFSETSDGFRSGTWMPTSGFNDMNQEDSGKYVDISTCDFLVDTQYPLNTEELPPLEPDYVADEENWEVARCEPFLDAGRTHPLARAVWVPDLPFVPERFRRKWGRHCLLKRK